MADRFDTLGSRILQAARMAVALHLSTVAESHSSNCRGQRRVVIGRAGPQVSGDAPGTDLSTDGNDLPAAGELWSRRASGAFQRPPTSAEGAAGA